MTSEWSSMLTRTRTPRASPNSLTQTSYVVSPDRSVALTRGHGRQTPDTESAFQQRLRLSSAGNVTFAPLEPFVQDELGDARLQHVLDVVLVHGQRAQGAQRLDLGCLIRTPERESWTSISR